MYHNIIYITWYNRQRHISIYLADIGVNIQDVDRDLPCSEGSENLQPLHYPGTEVHGGEVQPLAAHCERLFLLRGVDLVISDSVSITFKGEGNKGRGHSNCFSFDSPWNVSSDYLRAAHSPPPPGRRWPGPCPCDSLGGDSSPGTAGLTVENCHPHCFIKFS